MGRDMAGCVSILVCTCNGERFLAEQLDSIYGQTYENIEVFVSDDASSDATSEILEEYSRKRGLTYRVNRNRLGFVKNFEKAMSFPIRGDYIALSDQDDVWLPEKVATLVNGIGECSLICSDAELIDAEGRPLFPSFREFSHLQPASENPFNSLLFHNFVQGATALFKRELLEHALPVPPNIFYHDWWLALVASRRSGIRYLDERLIRYRVHEGNVTEVPDTRSVKRILDRYLRRNRAAHRRNLENHLLQLSDLRCHLLFKEDVSVIEEAIDYYRGLLSSRPHFRAFIIGLRRRKILYPSLKIDERLLYLLRDLFG